MPQEDGSFRAEITEFPGCTVTAETPAMALKRLDNAARQWIHNAIDKGDFNPKGIANTPIYSGKFVLRIPRHLHKKAVQLASRERVSLNQLILTTLSGRVKEAKSRKRGQRGQASKLKALPSTIPGLSIDHRCLIEALSSLSKAVTMFGEERSDNPVVEVLDETRVAIARIKTWTASA